jgi:hypothetical protein
MPQPSQTSTATEPKPSRPAKLRKIGPYSRIRSGIKGLDKRTKAARHIAKAKAALLAHIGGTASVTQMAVIDRAAVLSLRIALMEAQTGPAGEMTEKNSREFLCWCNAYCRLMGQLGLEAAPQRPLTTAEILARFEANKSAKAAAQS